MSEKPPIIESEFIEADTLRRQRAEMAFTAGFSTEALEGVTLEELVEELEEALRSGDFSASAARQSRAEYAWSLLSKLGESNG